MPPRQAWHSYAVQHALVERLGRVVEVTAALIRMAPVPGHVEDHRVQLHPPQASRGEPTRTGGRLQRGSGRGGSGSAGRQARSPPSRRRPTPGNPTDAGPPAPRVPQPVGCLATSMPGSPQHHAAVASGPRVPREEPPRNRAHAQVSPSPSASSVPVRPARENARCWGPIRGHFSAERTQDRGVQVRRVSRVWSPSNTPRSQNTSGRAELRLGYTPNAGHRGYSSSPVPPQATSFCAGAHPGQG